MFVISLSGRIRRRKQLTMKFPRFALWRLRKTPYKRKETGKENPKKPSKNDDLDQDTQQLCPSDIANQVRSTSSQVASPCVSPRESRIRHNVNTPRASNHHNGLNSSGQQQVRNTPKHNRNAPLAESSLREPCDNNQLASLVGRSQIEPDRIPRPLSELHIIEDESIIAGNLDDSQIPACKGKTKVTRNTPKPTTHAITHVAPAKEDQISGEENWLSRLENIRLVLDEGKKLFYELKLLSEGQTPSLVTSRTVTPNARDMSPACGGKWSHKRKYASHYSSAWKCPKSRMDEGDDKENSASQGYFTAPASSYQNTPSSNINPMTLTPVTRSHELKSLRRRVLGETPGARQPRTKSPTRSPDVMEDVPCLRRQKTVRDMGGEFGVGDRSKVSTELLESTHLDDSIGLNHTPTGDGSSVSMATLAYPSSPGYSSKRGMLKSPLTPCSPNEVFIRQGDGFQPLQNSRGQLRVSVYVNSGLLTAHVMEARHLVCTAGNTADTFVTLSVMPSAEDASNAKCHTDIIMQSTHPNYDEKFSFELLPGDRGRRLVVAVWQVLAGENSSYDVTTATSTATELLGCMSFGIHHVCMKTKEINGWFYLLPQHLGNQKYLRVGVHKNTLYENTPSSHLPSPAVSLKSYQVTLTRATSGYGFKLTGGSPAVISQVDQSGPAGLAGLMMGDFVTRINQENVSSASSSVVAKIIRHCQLKVTLDVQRPLSGSHTGSSPWRPDFSFLDHSSSSDEDDFDDNSSLMTTPQSTDYSTPRVAKSVKKVTFKNVY